MLGHGKGHQAVNCFPCLASSALLPFHCCIVCLGFCFTGWAFRTIFNFLIFSAKNKNTDCYGLKNQCANDFRRHPKAHRVRYVMFLFCLSLFVLVQSLLLHHFVAPPPMFILCCFSCILELCFSYFTAFCLHCCIVFSFSCTIALLVLRCFNCIDFLVVVVLSLQGIVIEKGGTMGASIVRSCAGIHRRNFALQRSSEGH